MSTGKIDTEVFDLKSLQDTLKSVRKQTDKGALKVLIEFGEHSQRHNVDAFVEGALAKMGKEAGFEEVEFIKRYQNHPKWQWRGLMKVDGTNPNEERLGNDSLLVFPLRTSLGRHLAGGYDCYIDLPGPLSLDSEQILSEGDKTTLRKAIKSMNLPEDATVRFHVHVEKPNDFNTIRDLPQVKKDSEFHRDAVKFLKSMGFDQVVLAVDVSSVVHTSRY